MEPFFKSESHLENEATSIIGPCCKLYREASKRSQLELSQSLGYKGSQMISNFERGICKLPPKQLIDYAKICSIPKEIIIGLYIADNLRKILSL